MQKVIYMTALLILFVGTSEATPPPPLTKEEVCKQQVDGTITEMEFDKRLTGKDTLLPGLTVAEIKQLAAEQGVCAADDAIKEHRPKK